MSTTGRPPAPDSRSARAAPRLAPALTDRNHGRAVLFDLVITQSEPPVHEQQQAAALLAGVLARHAALAHSDVLRRRDYLRALVASCPQRRLRILQADLERAGWLLAQLAQVRQNPAPEAAARLVSLLQLVDGPLEAIELARERLAVRVRPEHVGGRRLRILLVPEEKRRARLQIQDVARSNPQTLEQAAPRCYGETGHAYIGWALNRLDLRTLLLAMLAYLRVN